ncbi:hypothetical protein D3C81_910620 [compost metagenome]
MSVLLGFSNAQLGLAVFCQVFTEHVVQAARSKRRRRRDFCRVLGQANICGQLRQARPWEFIEVSFDEHPRQFTRAVGAEVHENHGVAVFDLDRFSDTRGLDELIALVAGISRFQAGKGGVGAVVGDAIDDQVIGARHTVPAVVAVHGVVAADQAGDATLAQLGEGGVEQFDGRLRTFRWRIAAIEEGMQVDLLGATLGGQFGHGDQVILVTVHAAIGQQAEDVYGLAAAHGLVDRATEHFVCEELAIFDGLSDSGEILVHNAAGTEVHVADLGVAHLPVRQTDVHARAGDQAVRLGGAQAIVDRRVGRIDGVVVGAFAVTETIQDDQDQGFWRARHQSHSRLFR